MSELVLEEARARGAITALLASRIVILIPHAVLDKNPMGSRDSSAYSQFFRTTGDDRLLA